MKELTARYQSAIYYTANLGKCCSLAEKKFFADFV